MDILRVLATPDLEVKKKTLQLALDLVSSRNVEEVSLVCKHNVEEVSLVCKHNVEEVSSVCKHNVEKGEFSQFISSVALYTIWI